MRKPIQGSDWAYLVLSFVLSLWLIEAQRRDLTLSEAKLLTLHRMSKMVRRVNIALMELELQLVHLCNQELERRNR